MSRFKHFGLLLAPALLALAVTVFADDKKPDEKKPDDKKADSLIGSTKYADTNKLTIEAEVDKGEIGIASVKFLGGIKTGMKGVRFPSPKAAEAPKGRTAQITINDGKDKKTEKVFEAQALYL